METSTQFHLCTAVIKFWASMGLTYGANSSKMKQKSLRQSCCSTTKLLLLHTAAGAAVTRAGNVGRSQLGGQHSNMDKASQTGIFSPLKGHSKTHILMSTLRAGCRVKNKCLVLLPPSPGSIKQGKLLYTSIL